MTRADLELHSLFLHNFRLFAKRRCEFGPSVNLIYGDNAVGKTSIIEAIYLLIAGRSHRGAKSAELTSYNTSQCAIETSFTKYGVSQRLQMTFECHRRKLLHNDTVHKSFSTLIGLIPGVILSPLDNGLIKGVPQQRRLFLDYHLSQIDPLYVYFLLRYHKALKERNAALRSSTPQPFEVFEEGMAKAAAYIGKKREEMVAALQEEGAKWVERFSGGLKSFQLFYKAKDENTFKEAYKRERARERKLGFTLTGPHRDDFSIQLGGREARLFVSEGESRSLAAALRLSEWHLLKKSLDLKPLMLIDDIGLGLDKKRLGSLLEALPLFGQVFVTSTEPLCTEALVMNLP